MAVATWFYFEKMDNTQIGSVNVAIKRRAQQRFSSGRPKLSRTHLTAKEGVRSYMSSILY
jgi:hypothetical protein